MSNGLRFLLVVFTLPIPACHQARQSEISKSLEIYSECRFSDQLEMVQVDPLAQGITARTVETPNGPKQVDMLGGIRIMFAYPNTDFFANVKVEKLPAFTYPQLKQILLENLDYMGSTPSVKIATNLHGLETKGTDREQLNGGVIGVYLLFDDKKQLVVTIYVLNQEPDRRKFQTIADYRKLRDSFLQTYSACIANHS